jgi:hypothetical protein
VQPSCSYQGGAPSTALEAVESYGHSLGKVLIVKVGYNESSAGYAQGIDQIMRAALREGASGVVWVTLREQSGYRAVYHSTNAAIRQAATRWPQLVADWNAYSAEKPGWLRRPPPHHHGRDRADTSLPYVPRSA